MAIQKKHGRGRLDKWYRLAKEKGYRARAAFKLIQLNKRYHVLESSRVLLDLCAAPGSWAQVAAETMPTNGIIIAVDLAPIKPIPRVISLQQDITSDQCRGQIRSHLKDWKVDTVLHDGAPNVGTAWVQDAYSQAELVLQALKLATVFLIEGGTFITKVFRSKDYNNLLYVLNQLFGKVEATKPPSSRNVSAEIFVVCRQYKAPGRIDPRLLDPKSVFSEVAAPTPHYEAKVFNPEVKKRKREGYDEDNQLQYKEISAGAYIESKEPIPILGSYNRIVIATPEPSAADDDVDQIVARLPETTEEIRNCCKDIRILGRKEFRMLLKWRLKLRDKLGISLSKEAEETEEVAHVEPVDEEAMLLEGLENMNAKAQAQRKRERRKENESKTKELRRLFLQMVAPLDIGLENSGPRGADAMFSLPPAKRQKKSGPIDDEAAVPGEHAGSSEEGNGEDESDVDASDADLDDDLEEQLDSLYHEYQERQSEKDAKYKAKKARKELPDSEWDGFDEEREASDVEFGGDTTDYETEDELETPSDGDDVDSTAPKLSNRAASFFSQDIFKDFPAATKPLQIKGSSSSPEATDEQIAQTSSESAPKRQKSLPLHESRKKEKPKSVTFVEPAESDEDSPPQKSAKATKKPPQEEKSIEIITLEAMTLAQSLASGQTSAQDLKDSSYNRHTFGDKGVNSNLPTWFVDDESIHSRGPQKPTTKAAADALRQKLRAINARPIKKVREARARKKMKLAARLEKLRKKSALIIENDEGMSEMEKAGAIARMMSRARGKSSGKKGVKEKTKLVVARGANKGISGRPGGVKGKYKIVDKRLKKDMRGLKRAKAKGKK